MFIVVVLGVEIRNGPTLALVNPEVNVMNWDQIEGKWKQMKGVAKQKWAKLTDDDLELIAGNREQFAGRLQERYGIAKDEAMCHCISAPPMLNSR